MKILIAVDMEGISGVVNWDQVTPGHAEYARFRQIMTDDVNAAVRGALEGGAEEVLIVDGHWNSSNILVEHLDRQARLQCGTPSPLAMVQGVETSVDGVFFIGYHARAGSQNAILDHTWSSTRVSALWLNQILVGETGLNAAVCGHFHAPVLLVSGDQTVCAEAVDLLGPIATVAVKRAVGRMSAECLPPVVAQERIQQAAASAVRRLRASRLERTGETAADPVVTPFQLATPVTVRVQFHNAEMADRAAIFPGASRVDGLTVEASAADMRLAYLTFRSLVGMA